MTDSSPALLPTSGTPTIGTEEAQRLTTAFLTGPMLKALRTVEYELPPFGEGAGPVSILQAARADIEVRHVPGAVDAMYRVRAYGDELRMTLQLNVWRFVIVYAVPAHDLVDVTGVAPRFERWQSGAAHAGWTVGWRDAVDPWDHSRHQVETYCYAMAERDFLINPMAQLYWRNDIVQMTRAFMLEAKRGSVVLASGP